jgi:hypothetical protein
MAKKKIKLFTEIRTSEVLRKSGILLTIYEEDLGSIYIEDIISGECCIIKAEEASTLAKILEKADKERKAP